LALTVTVCTVELLTVTVQVALRPFCATVGLEQVLAVEVAPEGVIENPLAVWLPGSAFRVMVKVCEWLTSFTPLGAMWMLASTHALVAPSELPWVPSVERVTRTPPMVTEPVALTVMFCTVELFTVTEHVAVLLTAVRLEPQVLL